MPKTLLHSSGDNPENVPLSRARWMKQYLVQFIPRSKILSANTLHSHDSSRTEKSHKKSRHKNHSMLHGDGATGTEDRTPAPANVNFRAPARLKCVWKTVNK